MARRTPEPVQMYRGTTAQHSTYTGPVGEITVDIDKDTLVVHDGTTPGGHPLAKAATTITASNGINVTSGGTLGANTAIAGVDASTSAKGVVQLSNSTNGTSQTKAATEKAVADALTAAKTYADGVAGSSPNVSNATGVLPVAHGGTGSSVKNFVDLSTAQSVDGVKTFTSSPIISANNPALTLKSTTITKGTNPDNTKSIVINATDSEGVANVNRLGSFITSVTNDGVTDTGLYAFAFSGSGGNAALRVFCSPDGTTKYATAPTPPAGDNSNKIATTAWVASAGISQNTVIADGSNTARTLSSRFADIINVKDFGAKGNGTVDDAAAIQAAIDYAESLSNFPMIYIPAGVYKLSTFLTISKPGIHIEGAGAGRPYDRTPSQGTLLSYAGGNMAYNSLRGIFTINYTLDNQEQSRSPSVIIKNLAINGQNKGVGVFAFGAYFGLFEGVNIYNTVFGMIFENHCYGTRVRNCEIHEYSTMGLDLREKCHAFVVDSCNFNMDSNTTKTPQSAIRIGSGSLASQSQTHPDVNSSNVSIINSTFDVQNHQSAIRIVSYCRGFYMAGNYIEIPESPESVTVQHAIRLDGVQNACIIGNRITSYWSNHSSYGIKCGSYVLRTYDDNNDPIDTTYYTKGCVLNNLFAGFYAALVYSDAPTTNTDLSVLGNVDQTGIAPIGLTEAYMTTLSDRNLRVGSIRVNGKLGCLGNAADGAHLYFSQEAVAPSNSANTAAASDNAYNLGASNRRWKELFCANSTINTSDARVKTNIEQPTDAVLRAWGNVPIHIYQFTDAVEKKGDSARLHAGVTAQEVDAAFSSEGLDASKYGLFCYDEWGDEYVDEVVVDAPAEFDAAGNLSKPAQTHIEHRPLQVAGNRYGIRYSEALCIEAAYQRNRANKAEARIAMLEERLTALEKKNV